MLAANGKFGEVSEALSKREPVFQDNSVLLTPLAPDKKIASMLQSFSPKEKREAKSRHLPCLLYSTADCGDLAGTPIPLNRSIMSVPCACGMSVWLRTASGEPGVPEFVGSNVDAQPEDYKCKLTIATTLASYAIEKQHLGAFVQ